MQRYLFIGLLGRPFPARSAFWRWDRPIRQTFTGGAVPVAIAFSSLDHLWLLGEGLLSIYEGNLFLWTTVNQRCDKIEYGCLLRTTYWVGFSQYRVQRKLLLATGLINRSIWRPLELAIYFTGSSVNRFNFWWLDLLPRLLPADNLVKFSSFSYRLPIVFKGQLVLQSRHFMQLHLIMLWGTCHKVCRFIYDVEERLVCLWEEAPVVLLLLEHSKGNGGLWIYSVFFQIYTPLVHGINRNNRWIIERLCFHLQQFMLAYGWGHPH